MSNFDSDPLICDSSLLPAKNIPDSAKSNLVFLERREEIEPWFWHIWIYQWLKFFKENIYIFFVFWFRLFQGEEEGQKDKPWVCPFSIKTRIFQKFFKQCFCLLQYYLWWKFCQNESEIQLFSLISRNF